MTSEGGFIIPPEVNNRLIEVAELGARWRLEQTETLEDGKLTMYRIILIWPNGVETGLWENLHVQ